MQAESTTQQNPTSETSPPGYVPEVKETGMIYMHFLRKFLRCQPSFLFAPDDQLDYTWISRQAKWIPDQLDSLLRTGARVSFFVRDNVQGINTLYSHHPCIYRYKDTYEQWDEVYPDLDSISNGDYDLKIRLCIQGVLWELCSPSTPNHESCSSTRLNADAEASVQSDYVPPESPAPSQLRRLIIHEGTQYDEVAELFGSPTFYQGLLLSPKFINLQLNWYKVIDNTLDYVPHHNIKWPWGLLYASNGEKNLQGRAVLIRVACPLSKLSLREQQRWTITLGASSDTINNKDLQKLLHDPFPELPLMLCAILSASLKKILKDWNDILSYMEKLVTPNTTILDPEAHDRLLFDDEEFSKSRLYFWIINSLETFIPTMKESRKICHELADQVRTMYPDHSPLSDQERQRLKDIKDRITSFDEAIERASALNQRLFNASAVLESRAANRLSENVKLLTYVSIFYLPLAFCTSLWSTTDTFSWNGLKIAMILTAILTYLITFNLNQIVGVSRTLYEKYKTPIVNHMSDSTEDDWRNQAARFRQFQPPRPRGQPSEWLLLHYMIQTVVSKMTARPKSFVMMLWGWTRSFGKPAIQQSTDSTRTATSNHDSNSQPSQQAEGIDAPEDSFADPAQVPLPASPPASSRGSRVSTTSQSPNASIATGLAPDNPPDAMPQVKPWMDTRTASLRNVNMLRRSSKQEVDLEKGVPL